MSSPASSRDSSTLVSTLGSGYRLDGIPLPSSPANPGEAMGLSYRKVSLINQERLIKATFAGTCSSMALPLITPE